MSLSRKTRNFYLYVLFISNHYVEQNPSWNLSPIALYQHSLNGSIAQRPGGIWENAGCFLLATSAHLSVQGMQECQAMNEKDISEIPNSLQHTAILK